MKLSDLVENAITDGVYIAWTGATPGPAQELYMCYIIRRLANTHNYWAAAYCGRIGAWLNDKYRAAVQQEDGRIPGTLPYSITSLDEYFRHTRGTVHPGVKHACPVTREMALAFWQEFIDHLRETGE